VPRAVSPAAQDADELEDLPDGRRAPLLVHARLRAQILSGELAPGTLLSQVPLARSLGVSRTPLREALRMLQEEGLVEAEPNRRARVRGFDPEELDSLYASRLLLESLAASLTLPHLSLSEVSDAQRLLDEMREHREGEPDDDWHRRHGEFHQLLVCRSGATLLRSLQTQAERSRRYVRLFQHPRPASGHTMGDLEHQAIVDAVADGAFELAVGRLGRHLARTAISVMLDAAPHVEPAGVRGAMRLLPATMAEDHALRPVRTRRRA